MFYSRPLFRTCEIICNHAARILEKNGSLARVSSELEYLDRKRMQCQRILNRIGRSHGEVCAECKGKCCGGERERDAFTDRVLQHPATNHRAARRRNGKMAAYEALARTSSGRNIDVEAVEQLEPVKGYCPEMTSTGCRIPYELRPIQCTAYFCGATAERLSESERKNGTRALAGLMSVQARTVLLAFKSRKKKQLK